MELSCKEKIMSENYSDFLVEWFINPSDAKCTQTVDSRIRAEYTPLTSMPPGTSASTYRSIPKLYGFTDCAYMEEAGILPLQRQPYLNLRGQDVLVGIADTGIEYQNPIFTDSAGKCRIAAIWDQTLTDGEPPSGFSYGREFQNEELQAAINAGVTLPTYDGLGNPSGTDSEISLYEKSAGHGTFLAGIAAGRETGGEFCSAAPDARLVVVKLKNAKQYLREWYLVDKSLPAVQENDICLGVRYLIECAKRLQRPMVILLGTGTSLGSHNGASVLGNYLARESADNGIIIVAGAGNEAISSHHYYGNAETDSYTDIEIRVADNVYGFTSELWSNSFRGFDVSIISPEGEVSPRVSSALYWSDVFRYRLSESAVTVQNEPYIYDGSGFVTRIRFISPAPGGWRLRVYGNETSGYFHVWLPVSGFLTGDVAFLKPDPDVTITEPANLGKIITVGACQYQNNSIYAPSGRGYTRDGEIKPDFAAAGANITGPAVYMGSFPLPSVTPVLFTRRSGTSVAAAFAAGACAQLLEWGVVKGNLPVTNTQIAKGYLTAGASRQPSVVYPNREWGYGTLDVYNALA